MPRRRKELSWRIQDEPLRDYDEAHPPLLTLSEAERLARGQFVEPEPYAEKLHIVEKEDQQAPKRRYFGRK